VLQNKSHRQDRQEEQELINRHDAKTPTKEQ
jgi:hypothetical protein